MRMRATTNLGSGILIELNGENLDRKEISAKSKMEITLGCVIYEVWAERNFHFDYFNDNYCFLYTVVSQKVLWGLESTH